MPRNLRSTAAWRISIWTTLAFALGTAGAFSIVYLLVAQGLRERSDTWLSGEADVLAQVSADTPSDHLYNRIVREVAELATQEVPDERDARGERLNSVFFLATNPNNTEGPLWVGPGPKDAFGPGPTHNGPSVLLGFVAKKKTEFSLSPRASRSSGTS